MSESQLEFSQSPSSSANAAVALKEPLLSSASPIESSAVDTNGVVMPHNTLGCGGGPRILDRDGTFSQSRGRWSVSNNTTYNRSHTTASGTTTRQRYNHRLTATASNQQQDTTLQGVPYGVSSSSINNNNDSHATNDSTSSNNNYCCIPNDSNNANALTPRRCWDDWFHTLSYTPTCILMIGVFIAYFITIVIFAGLYLTVNKVGVYYDHGSAGSGAIHGEMNEADVDLTSLVEVSDEQSSFCGMDINNHMEGECCSCFD